jgi:DNA-binding NarL/FixJ family response regulator
VRDVAQRERPLRVLIADKSGLFRDVLKLALERESDLEVAAWAADGPAAIRAAEEKGPDVALLSSNLPAYDGMRVSCMIKERVPDCHVIVLAEDEDQRLLTDGLGCGAGGFMTRNCSLESLVDGVRAVARGETLIPPVMLGPLLTDLVARQREHEHALVKLATLTRREREVLALVARGRRTSAIGETLVISPETARTHVQNILPKLGVHSRLEAASFVIDHALLDHLDAGVADSLERAVGDG